MVLRELLASFGLKFDEKAVEHASDRIEDLKKKAEGLVAVIAGGELVRGFAEMVEKVIDTGDELDTTSEKIGITTDALQEMRFAAKLNNVEAGELDAALFKLGRRAAASAAGNKVAADGFSALGVNIHDANGALKTTDVLFGEVADGLINIKDPGEQARVAFEVMGAGGGALIPILKKGSAGIEELRAKARSLGGVMSKETVKAAAELDEQIKSLSFAFNGVKTSIVEAVMPALGWLLNKGEEAVAWFRKLEKSTYIVQDALIALAATGLVVGAILLAPFLPFIATAIMAGVAVGALVLAFDALRVGLSGGTGDSQSWIDAIFGVGSKAKVAHLAVEALRTSLLALRDLFSGDDGVLLADALDPNGEAAKVSRREKRFEGLTEFDPNAKKVPKSFGRSNVEEFDRFTLSNFITSRGIFMGPEEVPVPPNAFTTTNTFNINGSGNPGAVADEVAQRLSEADAQTRRDAMDALKQRKGQ